MAKAKFLEWGNPVLSKKSKPVLKSKLNSLEVKNLIARMFDSIQGVGVGLAAVQLGILKKVIVVQYGQVRIAAINPEIIWSSKEQDDGWEGNLCVPGIMGIVRRAKKIKVSYWNIKGENIKQELGGFTARIFQHECEQMDGKNFIGSMPDPTKLVTRNEYKKRFTKR